MTALAAALDQPGLGWLVLAALLAGAVRGFAGFGSGLVFMPFAGAVLAPAEAVVALVVMDVLGPLPNIPAAIRTGDPREIGRLAAGMVIGLPLGLAALVWVAPEVFRWAVSAMALATVAALVSGWAWRGGRGRAATAGAGFLSGVVGGATGLPGPPVILYYMASAMPPAQVRANLTMFLVAVDLALVVLLGATGQYGAAAVATGLVLLVPFGLANAAGSRLFHPDRARTYRVVALTLIVAAALAGLPVWAG
ncbi:MAG: sulfite exporter TauE/SafE family protein [Gemmobacter sp.]